ncbi:MAG: response regulator [Alphaproteobacteria bacterium]|nr:response regulator [Alphaproteobacteria bacterium]
MRYLSLDKISFIVADRNKNIRQLISQFLATFGAKKVVCVANGQEVLDELTIWYPDVIITGWTMDKIDGLELTIRVRAMHGHHIQLIPILMISEKTELEDIIEARDGGINEFLAKPFSADSFYARLRSIVEHPRIFVKTDNFMGPCRRRRLSDSYAGQERRSRQNNLSKEQIEQILNSRYDASSMQGDITVRQ